MVPKWSKNSLKFIKKSRPRRTSWNLKKHCISAVKTLKSKSRHHQKAFKTAAKNETETEVKKVSKKNCLVSEREARDNNQTCRHVSPHAAEWRSLQLLVAVCRILSMCIRVSVCIWTCLHVFARICTYVRVPARICAYLRVSARICEYLPAFARILCVFAPFC